MSPSPLPSLNWTVIAITSPTLYVPLAIAEAILLTVGAVESITMSLFALREPAAPGLASVTTAGFPAAPYRPAVSARCRDVIQIGRRLARSDGVAE